MEGPKRASSSSRAQVLHRVHKFAVAGTIAGERLPRSNACLTSAPASPINAAPFTSCTRQDASSFPIPGTWEAHATCRASASRRSPPPAPDSRGRTAIGTAACRAYEVDTAVDRIRAARKAIDKAGGDTLLVGRAEGFLHGRPDIEHTVHRLKAYANAGADCLYAPGIRTPEHISAVVAGVAPKPVNLLMGWPGNLTMRDIAALGVRRVSVGGALARSAWGGFMRAAKLIVEQGQFDGFADAASGKELDEFFHTG